MIRIAYALPASALLMLSAASAVAEQPAARTLAGQLADEAAAPSVQQFIRDVLDGHPDVRAARGASDAAEARTAAARRPLYNPEVGLEYEDADVTERTVGLSQAIDWADKRGARSEVATAEQQAASADLDRIREVVTAGLVRTLADLASASELDRLAARRLELIERFRKLAERGRRAGDLSQVELDLGRLAAAEARIARAAAAVALADAERGLIELVGEIREWPPLPSIPPRIDAAGVDADRVLAGLPAMRSRRARMAAAESLVALRRRERRPDPTVSFDAGKEGDATLGRLGFSIPLYVRNDFSAEVDAARAEARAAGHDAESLERTLRSRLVGAARSYSTVRAAWGDWLAVGETSLDSQIRLLERLWRVGELSTTDYLVQLRQALDTRAEAERLRRDLWQRFVELLEASALAQEWAGVRTTTGGQP